MRRPARRSTRSGPSRRQPRHVRDRRAEARRRPHVALDVVGRAGPDAHAAHRQRGFPARDVRRHLVRPAAAARRRRSSARTTRSTRSSTISSRWASATSSRSTSSTTTARSSRPTSAARRPAISARGRRSRSSGSPAVPASRPTRSRRTSCCTRSARCLPAGCAERLPGRRRPTRATRPRTCSTRTTRGAPLSQLVLDFNHDDYYAHSGTWDDIQDSVWLHLLGRRRCPARASTIAGAGAVTSVVPGVDCSVVVHDAVGRRHRDVRCSAQAGRKASGSSAGPARAPGDGDCTVTLGGAVSVTATFGPTARPGRARQDG